MKTFIAKYRKLVTNKSELENLFKVSKKHLWIDHGNFRPSYGKNGPEIDKKSKVVPNCYRFNRKLAKKMFNP